MFGNLFLNKEIAAIVMSFLLVTLLSSNVGVTAPASASSAQQPIPKAIPSIAQESYQTIIATLAVHHDWIGWLEYSQDSAKISYLGPADSSPYNVKPFAPHVICASDHCTMLPLYTVSGQVDSAGSGTRPVNYEPAISADGNGKSIIYEEDANHTLITSSDNRFEEFDPVNAFAMNEYWLQAWIAYDDSNYTGHMHTWQMYANIHSYTGDTNLTCPSTFLNAYPISNARAGDTEKNYIYCISGVTGEYVVGATDLNTNSGQALVINLASTGDTGNGQIQLGEYPPGASYCTDESNTAVSEEAGGRAEVASDDPGATFTSSVLSQSYDQFNYGFYETPSSSMVKTVQSYLAVKGGGGATVSQSTGPLAYQKYTFDPTIWVFAQDQSGKAINGMYVSVYNSAHSLIQSGYTPMKVEVSSGGTYYVDYDNYGSNTVTSMSNYPLVTSYSIASWGGEATLNVPSSSIVQVFGNYATDSCPTSTTCTITVNSKDTNFNTISGLYIQLWQGSTNVANGWTTVQFTGVGNSNTYTVFANNYCNTSTHQQFTFTRWGDGTTSNPDTLSSLQHDTTITAYYSIGSC
jgi:hypothetical protein